jgi:hypothetical protein
MMVGDIEYLICGCFEYNDDGYIGNLVQYVGMLMNNGNIEI